MRIEALTVAGAVEGLRRKDFSAVELTNAYLAAISRRDHEIHSYLFVAEEIARASAKIVDRGIAEGLPLPALAGIPMAVKDNILVKDLPLTSGSRILEPYIASYDATVVARLKTAGAVILGKTNLDEFAMGSSTENSAFGPTQNPRDTSRVPGGSSGGSAAAVAGDLALAALGSDTGGSIRQPAAFTGVVGMKPTYGRVSRHGLVAMASSLDQIGPLAKNVEDTALVYQAVAGHDRYDATSSEKPVETPSPVSLAGLRIGVPKEYFGQGLDPRLSDTVRAALKKFETAGARVAEISLPHAAEALAAYYIVMPAEVSANLARFDGLRYGFASAPSKTILDFYKDTRDRGFGAEPKRRIMMGTYVLSHGYYDAYYLKAQKVRRLIRRDFEDAFKDVDVLMGPTTPSVAFPFGAKSSDPLAMYLEDIYTVAVNLSGVPALSLPCGTVAEAGRALPVGLQIIGSWFDEARLLGVSKVCESVLGKIF
ncbi:MAG: Asp-tRNA(Asn)/Glu-tRNA(Gln) amidotransferase subunit GatA [Candidatus Sungbacteria bacterium]|uniref:Glutamyl-tRNA(Gln) amidotransferase subunit A n=1 Tax=Candidatus Sungiibacteriota bacterium TaxID=2750080 RepID=A0A931SC20_9BACT|nr:Asp-tRNA(Asn)/Glu-tRNA(Gln) amidotransferase subunit GatA [Candidatus Sungbacteria bacterium]